MDKEKILTVVIGLVVGIVIAGGYFAVVKYLPQTAPKITFTPPQTNPPVEQKKQTLVISTPEDQIVVSESPVTVEGKANPGDKLIVFANADEKIASANAQGNFSVDVKLEDGENEISVTSPTETVKRIIIFEIKL